MVVYICLWRFSSCSDVYFHESATVLYKLNKHFSKHNFVQLLWKLRLISMSLLRKVNKGPLDVPGQQAVLARAKKCIKETASLTSHNVFTISIFIKHVKECDHKVFQGLTALVYWFFLFFKWWQKPSSQGAAMPHIWVWKMTCWSWRSVLNGRQRSLFNHTLQLMGTYAFGND